MALFDSFTVYCNSGGQLNKMSPLSLIEPKLGLLITNFQVYVQLTVVFLVQRHFGKCRFVSAIFAIYIN